MEKIFYVCDGKACEDHYGRPGRQCFLRRGVDGCHHTSDIKHAVNFTQTIEDGPYFEKAVIDGVELPRSREEDL